ncbi:MAG: 4-hydroxy-tetrahydrodipicolinate synthase [Nitrospirota bacterium]|jgi:4-hydroxy-tetrahydrodipicolinate synthase|nr:4-hydroxy-tetrahydrodipicolinate synthase [Nitrospirota bacterium]MDH4359218.1 4-hydroxy-tetrahydrodipicolinate synthase [Nitrospirota bacterium]MDH5295671.1 4-hydroxy-tetrahydrodipicolinate synthase [Nitrospirota bacterium]MDH5574214.1 4-hydroxy-tetrahydrodipicolinate synthase [Nitrospirota bacterium]
MFSGSLVAIVTPFSKGKFDEKAMAELIEFQIAHGTHGIVPCGTTGESATLTPAEHERVVSVTVEVVNKRIPVIAGTGSNSTDEAITFTKHAKDVGADAALLITPYYNKPPQEGLYRHFAAVAKAVDLPQILYNIPGRTSINMLPATVSRLSEIPNIVGIKEGSGSLQQVSDIIQRSHPGFLVLSGDDSLTLPMIALGGKGVITVTANVAPTDMAHMVNTALEGNYEKARRLHYKLAPLFEALFFETNPIPVKAALAMMGKMSEEVRLPLTPLAVEFRPKLQEALQQAGVL